jgi:hypothetical protein
MKYFIEAKIDGKWFDAFRWADLYTTREEAQNDLNDFLNDGAFKTGMDTNTKNYRITEVKND